MRKLYSIVLMACAMLFSTSVFAVDVNNLTALQNAIDNTAPGGTVDIRLTGSIDIANDAMPIRVYAKYSEAGKTVNLDLNGYNIISHNNRVIELFKGTLNITGNGTIQKTAAVAGGTGTKPVYSGGTVYNLYEAIFVTGSFSTDDSNWSNLTLGKNVKVMADYDNGIAVSINEFRPFTQKSTPATWAMPAANLYGYDDMDVTVDGATFKYDSYYKHNDKKTANYNTVWDNKNPNASVALAYGVNVTVNGYVYGKKYGIKVNGSINGYEQDGEGKVINHPYPYVHVTSTAEVSAYANSYKSIGVYASGYGKVDIEGEVHASTGVAVKGGQVTFTDANIYSDYVDGWKAPEETKSGVSQAGSAVTVESTKNYPGHHTVVVAGDTKLTGNGGYALEESITDAKGETKVTGISIEGGTFAAGVKGTITLENNTIEKDAVSVTGAVLNTETVKVKTNDGDVEMPVGNLIPNGGAGYQTITVAGEGTKTITSVVKTDVTINNASTIAGATGSISWTGLTETLSADKSLDNLVMNAGTAETKQVLTIGDGTNNITFTVGQITMSAYAQIIVKPGSRLVVTGKEGVVATVTDNIVLETKEGNPAQFLFNPAVTSNRHPKATVEFVSKSTTNGANYKKQRFGIPTYEKPELITAQYNNAEIATQFDMFNYETEAWENVGYIHYSKTPLQYEKIGRPFEYYQLQNNNTNTGTFVTFKGRLVGNVNPNLEVREKFWNGFANSFMGKMSIDKLLNMIPNSVDKAVYLYDITADHAKWEARTFLNEDEYTEIDPMQPFLIRNTRVAAYVDVNYEKAVYNHVLGINDNAAPVRRVASDMTRAKLILRGEGSIDRITVAESNDFTADFDNGYDAVKYMNDGINMYVSADEKMSIYATDNLENTYVGVASVNGGTYSISFEKVAGESLTLIDLETGAMVDMTEGNSYEFNVAANTMNDYRFQIVGRAAVATDVENISAANNGAVYTIMGQYVGQMSEWNNLPAGIYVVDGVKRVK